MNSDKARMLEPGEKEDLTLKIADGSGAQIFEYFECEFLRSLGIVNQRDFTGGTGSQEAIDLKTMLFHPQILVKKWTWVNLCSRFCDL